jgi:hypothetical protein
MAFCYLKPGSKARNLAACGGVAKAVRPRRSFARVCGIWATGMADFTKCVMGVTILPEFPR